MKFLFIAFFSTLAMVTFQNCTDAEFDVGDAATARGLEAGGNTTAEVDGNAMVVDEVSTVEVVEVVVDSSQTQVVTDITAPNIGTGFSIPVVDTATQQDIIINVPDGIRQVLIDIPADANGTFLVSHPGSSLDVNAVAFNGLWNDVDVSSFMENFLLFTGFTDIPLCAQEGFRCEDVIAEGQTFTGVIYPESVTPEDLIASVLAESTDAVHRGHGYRRSTFRSETLLTVRGVILSVTENQQFEVPDGGGSLLVNVPEGVNQFILRVFGGDLSLVHLITE